ncbi:MAG: serine protease [Candidatus Omnitrophica bacterium]|nr:serine protease [Candidatus Omnitrophota bacterium]
MNCFRRNYRLAIVLAAVLSGSQSAQASSSLIADLNEASKSMVRVSALAEGFDSSSAGTGLLRMEKTGAGILITSSGVIVTNAHTLAGAQKVAVQTHDGQQWPAALIAVSGEDDLALLKIETGKALPFAQLASAEQLTAGDTLYTIGNSMFLKQTLSEGILLGIGRKGAGPWGGGADAALLRISFKVYPGDSGTPILSRQGKLYGIISANAGQTAIAVSSSRILLGLEKFYPEWSGS